ncbi:hypothetical protein Fmac_006335 [Flemingia macrophylla]|uniref:RING-type E3 ubiquitin transferase n=1 Tax=Flemingia macrophylla TaxID=520843 RepID=A0ABD1ND20_9FABA
MGNISSSGGNPRRRHSGAIRRSHPPPPPPPVTPLPEIAVNPMVYPGPAPYPNAPLHYPQYPYPGYYPPVPMAQPPQVGPAWAPGRYPCGPVMPSPAPFVEHQKAVTIKNDVNIRKDSLLLEPDHDNPGHFLLSFSFDATLSGSITVYFFAKEGEGCTLTPTKENLLAPLTVNFREGLGQKFRQPAGTGIDFSVFEESELLKVGDMGVYPLAVKADASPCNQDEAPLSGNSNSQTTQAVFEKDKGEFRVKVVKQILWVNGMRYELQEIYGIGNSTQNGLNENDQGKECVVCLSEPRDTIVHPCRHMCMCSNCAKVLRFQTNRCPICRQPVERLLEIKVGSEE